MFLTYRFITTTEFSRLTKISFGARIKEPCDNAKSLATNSEILDLGDKNTKKL